MNSFYKQLLFIILGIVIILSGGFIIRAINNRGNDPFIYLKFNEGYGATTTDSINSNDGAIINAQWKTEDECKEGSCFYFDGTGDYISITDFQLE